MVRKVTRGRLFRWGLVVGLAVGISTAPAPALGQPKRGSSAKDPKAEALDLFNQSAELYRKGNFDEAARLLERAYQIHPEPVLLYNLGRAYEGLGQNQKAIDAYERYLKDQPDAKDRGALERRIETLKSQQEKIEQRDFGTRDPDGDKEEPPPKPVQRDTTPPPPATQSGGAGVWPWVVTGVGAATIGAGLFIGIQAKNKRNDAQDNPVNRDANSQFEDAKSLAKTANTLIIAGAIITGAGITWAILGSRKQQSAESSKLHVTVLPSGVVVGGHL